MRVLVLAALVVAVTACGGGRATTPLLSPTGPLVATREPTPVRPDLMTVTFLADLSPSAEVPAVTDEEASCTGQTRLVLRVRLDPSGNMTTGTAHLSLFLRSCPIGTRITLAHVHQGRAGENGAVKIDSGLKANTPIVLREGELLINQTDIPVTDMALVADIIANPATYYVNVHSAQHPDGVLRAQLAREG